MKKKRGSFTLEAVIVMSTIIFIIFAIVSAFLLLYQNAVMYYVATQAAQEGAVMWADNAHDLDGNVRGQDNQSLYYRLADLVNQENEAKEGVITSWIQQKMKKLVPRTLIGSGTESVDVQFHDYVVQRVVEVRITKEVKIPFKEIVQFFGKDLKMTVHAKASVSEPAEFIRNVDYGYEIVTTVWKKISSKMDAIFKAAK